MPFQTVAYQTQAPAVAGDFASANVRTSVLAGPGALVTGPAGATVGRFAWADVATDRLVSSNGIGAPTGFLAREMQAMITTYLGETSMVVAPGREVTLYSTGDFWVVNSGANFATIGMKAYADNSTGLVSFGATATPPSSGAGTAAVVATTGSFTGSIAANIMTITAVGSGVVVNGGILSGTGVVTGTQVTSQISGAVGGIGTYYVNISQTVASTTISETYGVMTITVAPTATFALGQVVAGANITAGTVITQLGTGTGGLGTYIVSPTQTAASAAITSVSGTETKWYAMSEGAAGELIKLSSRPLG